MKIKNIIEEIKKMSLLEIKELIESIEEEFDVKASSFAASASSNAGDDADVVAEKTSFSVVLTEVGPNKIAVIKKVKELLDIGLIDSKKLIEKAPIALKDNVNKEIADKFSTELKEVGAAIELK